MDLVSVETFLKSPTCGGTLIIFPQKLYFVNLYHMVYSIYQKEAWFLKLWTFKNAFMFMLLFQLIGFKVLDI